MLGCVDPTESIRWLSDRKKHGVFVVRPYCVLRCDDFGISGIDRIPRGKILSGLTGSRLYYRLVRENTDTLILSEVCTVATIATTGQWCYWPSIYETFERCSPTPTVGQNQHLRGDMVTIAEIFEIRHMCFQPGLCSG